MCTATVRQLALKLSLLAACLGGCAAAAEEPSRASADAIAARPRVLALGDSIAFGWDPHLAGDPSRVVASRYVGYAELVAGALDAEVDNASCPGETSSHFMRADGEDNGCAANRAAYALKVDWGTAKAQVDFALGALRDAVAAGRPPVLITMSIGGNDLLRVEENCKLPGPLGLACKLARLPFYEHAYGENLERLMLAIDATGYHGKMVLLTTYAPDYSDPLANFGLGRFNDEIRESVARVRGQLTGLDVRVADGFAAFEEAAKAHGGKTCATGLLISLADGTCDIHPSRRGHEVLAEAILAAARDPLQ